jgi:hypothetical protein
MTLDSETDRQNLKMKYYLFAAGLLFPLFLNAQNVWLNVDSIFGPLPDYVHVFRTNDSLEGKPNIAYYVKIPLRSKGIVFDADTTLNRRLTPSAYFERNNQPLIVVNCTFFSPDNRNVNVVMDKGKMVSGNVPSVFSKTDSLYHYLSRSALGINKARKADVAWIYTDENHKRVYELKQGPLVCGSKVSGMAMNELKKHCLSGIRHPLKKWRMRTAVGGGPTLISNGVISITNEEERMFAGKAIQDRHPRTAMGYTADGNLIILSIQGRFPGIAEGATLGQEAQILKDLGCAEALNLDGGGSSCLLINGKETITPCDKTGQRPVPAVFMVKIK